MTSRSWEALVVEGKRLGLASPLDRWAIGDLAVEAVPPGKDRAGRSAAQEKLQEFSRATGISFNLLKDCHRTSTRWPLGSRIPDISQARHSRYASRPNRVSLLLNDDLKDGLSVRLREKVEKAEELLSDKEVRNALLDRSKSRSQRIRAAARAIEDEELLKARIQLKIQEQDARARLAEPEIMSKAAERAIRGNRALAKMVADILDLKSVVHDIPPSYHERTAENLSQVSRAAQQTLDMLRPEPQSPQPRTVIISCDDQPGAEHW
jgi:hypothetical protein